MLKFRPQMFTEAEKTHATSKLALQILIFIAFFFISQLATGTVASFFAMPSMMEEMANSEAFNSGQAITFEESYNAAMKATENNPTIMIASLFATAIGTFLSILYCRTIEHRSYGSMGFRKRKAVPHYLMGLVVGVVMMSAITGLSVVTGISEISMTADIQIGMILLYFFGFFIQGMSEEVIFRGYFMNTLGGKHSAAAAILISSVGFAIAHLANPGITVLAFVNLTLFGIFAALYMICFDDIWGACAIHSIWNFTQGNIFGISVSGTGEAASVFRTTAVSDKAWLSGGEFGIEGSILTTVVLVAASVIVLLCIKKNQSAEIQQAAENN